MVRGGVYSETELSLYLRVKGDESLNENNNNTPLLLNFNNDLSSYLFYIFCMFVM
jgi:hypothetical protein